MAWIGIENTQMDYIRFGTGERILFMLPGLGDGLKTVKGTALPMAWLYRMFAKRFTVYVFSRKNNLSQGDTTRDMARDQKQAMDQLGIKKAHIFGVSMGGMIAQHLAVDYPEVVDKLILTVTSARSNDLLVESVKEWMDQAQRGDHKALMDSNMRRICELEERQDSLEQLASSVSALATREERVEKDVKEIKVDVKALAEKPAKRWDDMVDKTVWLVLGSCIAFLLSEIGL